MTALLLLRRFWWAPIIIGLIAAVLIQRATIARKDAALEHVTAVMADNIARVEKATLAGKLAATIKARAIEAAQTKVTQEVSGEYAFRLAAAQALAATHLRRVRNDAQAYRGDLDGGAGGGTADPTGTVVRACSVSELSDDDMQILIENTVKAIGWRAWWLKIQAIPR